MRVGFAGTPEFAQVALARLHDAGFTIPLVLTQPAHLQKLMSSTLDGEERNAARARYLRSRLRENDDSPLFRRSRSYFSRLKSGIAIGRAISKARAARRTSASA